MSQEESLARVAPLFLVLFIDGMGLSLLFPIMNSMIMEHASTFLPSATTEAMREFIYGVVIGIYMICWFFGAAIMGDLSDISGRKKSLLVCLIGACIGYVLSGVAINIHSIALLVLGRIIAGFTAGSQPIAQAAIVDVSIEEHKARNIGLILFSVSVGFILGPLIGGVLSNTQYVSWFGFSTPMYFAALISFLNAFLLQFTFHETFKRHENIHLKFTRAMTIFVSAFKHHKIRNLSLVLVIMMLGWAAYYSFIPLYLIQQYHYSTAMTAYFMTVLGIGFGIGCGFLVDYCSKRFMFKTSVICGTVVAGVFTILTLTVSNQAAVWVFAVIIGAAVCVAYSIILAIFSDQVSENEQGWVMGVTGSIMALCFGITILVTSVLVEVGKDVPLIVALVGLILAGLLMWFVKVDLPNTNVNT